MPALGEYPSSSAIRKLTKPGLGLGSREPHVWLPHMHLPESSFYRPHGACRTVGVCHRGVSSPPGGSPSGAARFTSPPGHAPVPRTRFQVQQV